jgi:hypothetical protein
MHKRGYARLLCLALALLGASLPAVPQAAGSAYTVEFVLFRTDGGTVEPATTAPSLSSSAADITVTPVTTHRLAGAASKLRSAGGYKVIAHVAWTQVPTAWNSRRGVPVGELGVDVPGLTGSVILERGQRNLRLGFDLKFEEGGRSMQLAQFQPLKVDEAQYFDHPQLGVVALVTRTETR